MTTKPSAKQPGGFSAEEKAAMREQDRVLAGRIHAMITATAPQLVSRTWYGMPAYAKDDKILCYFRDAQKFKTRYATFGFSDNANLDDGDRWPTDFALTQMTAEVERRIAALVEQAVS